MPNFDLFIFAAENSADIHGANLIKELLAINPNLKIASVAGPKMRELNIHPLMRMEDFLTMGFIDIIFSLIKLIKNFFYLRKMLLKINPKACIFIDYPDFNLRLEKSLRKKGYKNKLIHYISPSVWAWRHQRSDFMAKYLDLLITIFPFEKKYFSHTDLEVRYIGHPLAYAIQNVKNQDFKKDFIGIFPGSRKTEIERNFPLQLKAAKKLLAEDKNLKFAISISNQHLVNKIFKAANLDTSKFIFFTPDQNYLFMQKLKGAMATSGTINLELALNKVPTVVNFAIKPLDLFIARKILKINLKFYCIVNIILQDEIFTELYGPNLNVNSLFKSSKKLFFDEKKQNKCKKQCSKLKAILASKNANKNGSEIILSLLEKYP